MMPLERALVRMPEVTGLPLRKARLLVENSGLAVAEVVFQESYDPRDTVLTQRPARGQMVYAHERVTLGVSRESYVKWLPSIFQRPDVNGRNFFRDFLWIIQHLFSSVEETLEVIHEFFDPYEAPEKFLPWLASWSAMVLEEDWPIEKKRRLIRKAIALYRIRGTVKGLKLFIALFTGHEPDILENQWPFRGWRVGVTSEIAVDTVVLPPVNLAHTFIVEMPVTYKDVSTEAVIRIHEIIQMEKPANTQYYLRFACEDRPAELREFFAIGMRSGIGIGAEVTEAITSEAELAHALAEQAAEAASPAKAAPADDIDDGFRPVVRQRPPLQRAPRADTAPVESLDALATGELAASAPRSGTRRTTATTAITGDVKEAKEVKDAKAGPDAKAKEGKDAPKGPKRK